MITAAALTFVINIATAVLKWLYGRIGRVGTQAVVFVFALIAALFVHFDYFTPGLKSWLLTAAVIFSLAVALYEVVLQNIPFFKGPDSSTDGIL